MKDINRKMKPKVSNFFKPPPPSLVPHLPDRDLVVRCEHARPVRVIWTHHDGKQVMNLDNLHKLLADDPALGLAVLRVLREWGQGRVCSEGWGPTRSYKHTQWARMKEVGYVGVEDEEVWGGDGRQGDGSKGGGGGVPAPRKPPPPPPRAPQPYNPAPHSKKPPPPPRARRSPRGSATQTHKRHTNLENSIPRERHNKSYTTENRVGSGVEGGPMGRGLGGEDSTQKP